MKKIILCISAIHSGSYMENLAEIAIKNKNFWLAEIIYRQQKNENQIVNEIKDKYIKRYNALVDPLYS
jgi:hypothetical protein